MGLLLCIVDLTAHAQSLPAITQLSEMGAPELALQLLDDLQPAATENLYAWQFFERERFIILRRAEKWSDLVQRFAMLPDDLPLEFVRWANLERVNAELQLGDGVAARQSLRWLLWQQAEPAIADHSLYRRLLIRSFLVEDNVADAENAMRRYQQDYQDDSAIWRQLQLQVLLRAGFPGDAVHLLKGQTISSAEMQALALLADLRSGSVEAKKISQTVTKELGATDLTPVDQARFWFVLAEAASQTGDALAQIIALEQVLLRDGTIPPHDKIFMVDSDQLWRLYRNYALQQGNARQLLWGQDETWLNYAKTCQAGDCQPTARAIYAILILDAADATTRQQAAQGLLDSTAEFADQANLLRALFLDAAMMADISKIPYPIRYWLVDDALQGNDILTAAGLMQGMENAPAGEDAIAWGLRRARILILGNEVAQGLSVLQNLLPQIATAEATVQDRYIQILFDLQTVNQHNAAIELFQALLQQPLTVNQQRELLFWQAESHAALKQATQAAWLYLRSATLLDGVGMDPWGQTARFQAAEQLTAAGLTEDAERIYQLLLRHTQDPTRRAMLRYKMQELWLKDDE